MGPGRNDLPSCAVAVTTTNCTVCREVASKNGRRARSFCSDYVLRVFRCDVIADDLSVCFLGSYVASFF